MQISVVKLHKLSHQLSPMCRRSWRNRILSLEDYHVSLCILHAKECKGTLFPFSWWHCIFVRNWSDEMLMFLRVNGHKNVQMYAWNEHEITHGNFTPTSYNQRIPQVHPLLSMLALGRTGGGDYLWESDIYMWQPLPTDEWKPHEHMISALSQVVYWAKLKKSN